MARSGITKARVQQARDSLLARGEPPSIEAVRVQLGHTGSKTTIQRYLKELAAQPAQIALSLDQELHGFIQSVAERLRADAQAAVALDRARLERQQAAATQQRAMEQARLEELQHAHAALTVERREGLTREQALNERLHAAEGDRQRLAEAQRQQQQLLEERAAQLHGLTGQLRHAQEALAHYRQAHLTQREQEHARHDAQSQQWQQETRLAHTQLLAKQEELSLVYRDLERLNGELGRHQHEHHRLNQLLRATEGREQVAREALQGEHSQSQVLRQELAAQREKTKRHLLKQRHDQHALRRLRQQLESLPPPAPAGA